VREQCRGEPRYEAIGSLRAKERLFRTYQDTLAQLEALTRQRSERAQAGYRVSTRHPVSMVDNAGICQDYRAEATSEQFAWHNACPTQQPILSLLHIECISCCLLYSQDPIRLCLMTNCALHTV